MLLQPAVMNPDEPAVPPLETAPSPRGALTWRSALLAVASVVMLASIAPFNDWAVENTFMVGSYLPLFMVLWFFVLVVCINAPLHRWFPRQALSSGELTVILAATLAASALPSQGMLRQLSPLPVSVHQQGVLSPNFWALFSAMDLPAWLWAAPVDESGPNDRIVSAFYTRVQEGEPIPYAAWIAPVIGWGVFVAGLFVTLICLACIARLQWADNERLPFPVAHLQAMLIEPPERGHMLNRLFRSKGFWIACGSVVVLHSISALHTIYPRTVPLIPLRFDFRTLMSEPPWLYFSDAARSAGIYFTFIGVVYFIPSKVAFSLWFFFLLQQLAGVQARVMGGEISGNAWMDQHAGAAFAFLGGIIWIGRHHWWMVICQMFRGPRAGEPTGWYITYRLAGWLAVAGVGVMFAWLLVVGVTWWWALVILAFLLTSHVVTARIVAQTGLPFIRTQAAITQLYPVLSTRFVTGPDVLMAGAMTMIGPITTRESLMTFAQSTMQTNEQVQPNDRRSRRIIIGVIALALVVAFAVGWWSHLRVYYNHAMPVTITATGVENPDGLLNWPNGLIAIPVQRHAEGSFPPQSHSTVGHFAFGALLTGVLQWGSLTFPNWPLAPVGYLTAATYFINVAWFSLLIGWLLKVLIVRFGGSHLYTTVRPIFVGVIFGEALAAALWMIVTLAMVSAGHAVERIRLLPG
jgi:hypothetical protein